MEKSGNIRRYSATELSERRARGESRTDLARLREENSEELERAAQQQLKEDGFSADWFKDALTVRVEPKKLLSLRLDQDVIDWFKDRGPGYQTRINAVLKAYIKHATD